MTELSTEPTSTSNSDPAGGKLSYRALDSDFTIRILLLHPANSLEDPLVTDLIHEDRNLAIHDDTGEIFWDAVSYTWGENPQFSCKISCNGATLLVTSNVDILLRNLRKRYKIQRLWIDAICLNQTDTAEKTRQVPLMGDIYSEARKVIVWLGLDQEIMIGEEVVPLSAVSNRLRRLKAHSRSQERLAQPLLASSDHILIRKFLELPWFNRRWTIQEVALHSHVVLRLGNCRIIWSEFKTSLEFVHEELKLQFKRTDNISLSSRRILWTYLQYTNIFDLMWKFDIASCRDERDRIGAFEGMGILKVAPHTVQERTVLINRVPPRIDYALPWLTNYSTFARRFLFELEDDERNFWVHIIAFGSLSSANYYMPSWIPDWRKPRKEYSFLEELVVKRFEGDSNEPLTRVSRHIFFPYGPNLPPEADDDTTKTLARANNLHVQVSGLHRVLKVFAFPTEGIVDLAELKELFVQAPTWVLKSLIIYHESMSQSETVIFQSLLGVLDITYNTRSCNLRCHSTHFAKWILDIVSKREDLSRHVQDNALDEIRHLLPSIYSFKQEHQTILSQATCEKEFIDVFVPQLCKLLLNQVLIVDDQGRAGLASTGIIEGDLLMPYLAIPTGQLQAGIRMNGAPALSCIVVRETKNESLMPQPCPCPAIRYVGIAACPQTAFPSQPNDGISGDMILV